MSLNEIINKLQFILEEPDEDMRMYVDTLCQELEVEQMNKDKNNE